MLSDDEEEKAFEDIDLDKLSEEDEKSQINSLNDLLANFNEEEEGDVTEG